MSESGCNQRLLDTLEQLRKAAAAYPNDDILQLGDLHHVSQPEPAVIGAVVELLQEWTAAGRKVVLMAGNHDASASDKHALQAYQGLRNVYVVGPDVWETHTFSSGQGELPTTVECVGWTTQSQVASAAALRAGRAHVLACHAAVLAHGHMADASTEAFTSAFTATKKLPPLVVSGHLHSYEARTAFGTQIVQLGAFQGVAHGEWNVGHVMRLSGSKMTVAQYPVPATLRVEGELDALHLHVMRRFAVYAECAATASPGPELALLAKSVSISDKCQPSTSLLPDLIEVSGASYLERLEQYARQMLPENPSAVARVLAIAREAMKGTE